MTSPARLQYLDLKRQHPDSILLYRLGDFYEMFDEDARTASTVLGIQLTARTYPKGEGRVPMAGVPHHSVQGYIKRLLAAGHTVALCEQTGEAGKGLVDREVVRVYTPGTVVEENLLEPGRSSVLAAAAQLRSGYGLAYVDISTGEIAAVEMSGGAEGLATLEAELLRVAPEEWLLHEGLALSPARSLRLPSGRPTDWHDRKESYRLLSRHFRVASLGAFGLDERPAATVAVAALITYLARTNPSALSLVEAVKVYTTQSYMLLDPYTRSSLEILPEPGQANRWSLFRVLNRTQTPMATRRLREMIGQPLLDPEAINSRLSVVGTFVQSPTETRSLQEHLGQIGDLQRALSRIVQSQLNYSDVSILATSLEGAGSVKAFLSHHFPGLHAMAARIDPMEELVKQVRAAINLDSGHMRICDGFSSELDEVRSTLSSARSAMAELERSEIEATGIKNLKVGYNKVFGYYVEAPKSSSERVPDHYTRQQTLLNVERYLTPEIKQLESRINEAKERSTSLEDTLFAGVRTEIVAHRDAVFETAAAVAEIDALRALADVAITNNYCKPDVEKGADLWISDARHPVVESANPDMAFVPNDCVFDGDQRIILLTGPNMGGKSTMLRTVALVVLMAQIGSYVPATEARIGLVDRIFSRVGAQDDISAGQSTFMTEMIETANILHHASPRSLLILDEIGRGTSTYDGLAIARAILEFLQSRLGSRTLFATHYHELTALADELSGVSNFHTEVADHDGGIVFLHRVVPGGADRSYGIHVARLAGLPHSVTVRAERILRKLEQVHSDMPPQTAQLALFAEAPGNDGRGTNDLAIDILDELLALDLANTTPLEALEILDRYQNRGRSDA